MNEDCMSLAKCNECPLKLSLSKSGEWKPIPAEINKGKILVINEHPGKQETLSNRPFVGHESVPIIESIEAAGWKRTDLDYTYVVACRYPNGKSDEYLSKLKSLNKKRKLEGKEEFKTPSECCAPRLKAEVAQYQNIITLGSVAINAVGVDPALSDGKTKLQDFSGFPTTTRDGRLLLPTVNSVHHTPMDRVVLDVAIKKAKRYFAGKLVNTIKPEVIYKPSVEEFWTYAQTLVGGYVSSDVETSPSAVIYDEYPEDEVDSKGKPKKRKPDSERKGKPIYDGYTDPLRCIGFGQVDKVYIIPFAPVSTKGYFTNENGERWFDAYTDEEMVRIKEIIVWILVHPEITKVGHNFGYYDQLVILNHFGCEVVNLIDTILVHQLGDSEYLHRLAFVLMMLTDIMAWKAEHTASEAKNDKHLYYYCGQDTAGTMFAMPLLIKRAKEQKQWDLYDKKRLIQKAAVGMHILGLHVDEERRREHADRLNDALTRTRADLLAAAGPVNPFSPGGVADLLFNKMGLPIQDYTDSGNPSSDDASLRKLLIALGREEVEKTAIIKLIRNARRHDKQYGTYIKKWAPGGKFVDKNGLIRPDYAAHGTVGWRYSSSNPNFQNIPKKLRDCFIAPEGQLFVAADMDQLELRMAAAISGADYFIDAFQNGTKDVHNLSGELMFGADYYNLEGAPESPLKKGTGKFAMRRGLAKKIVFTTLYGGSAQAVLLVVQQDEDDEGNLAYAHILLKDIRYLQRNWLTYAPQFKQNWNAKFNFYQKNGYIAEPIWGLRRYCANGADFNEIINFEVQGGAGAVINDAMFDLVFGQDNKVPPIPFDFAAGTGLNLQVHDQLVFRVKADKAEYYKQVLIEEMTRKYPNLPVTFTPDAAIGRRLSEV